MRYTEIFNKAIKHIAEELCLEPEYDYELDLRELYPELSPAEAVDTLRELKWVETDREYNGWEQDTWIYFFHKDYLFDLCLFYSGYYWSLVLSGENRREDQ